jgi:hypothetical protein
VYMAFLLNQTTHPTFGRETAQYQELLVFMGIVSLAIWSIVVTTIFVRMGWTAWQRKQLESQSEENVTVV